MEDKLNLLRQWINESCTAVFFGGAGVSTESGIPDFRSPDGLYSQQYTDPPEEVLSHTFFLRSPKEFYRFYKDKMNCLAAQPNTAHLKLAKLEQAGKLRSIVTQNIDGLHQKAGSRRVWELHGSIHRNFCMRCGQSIPAQAVFSAPEVPRCPCGGMVKPDVVLYEEGLDSNILEGAVEDIRRSDLLIVGGTSLAVYPAAGLLRYYEGRRLVLINQSPTPYDDYADLFISAPIGQVFGAVVP